MTFDNRPVNRARVQAFFETYRAAFDRLDGDAVADLWHGASSIAQGDAVTVWADDAPMRDNMHKLCALYRSRGYASADFELVEVVPMGERHAFALVQWQLWRAGREPLQRFRTGYTLGDLGAGPRVLMCTAFEEVTASRNPDAAG